ncbi:ABC transporter ATP-binding protein [Mesobacterium pallidum]|uniref:ABC transporter ATP-binding protein n=1 Tax=Mesobacterium pallidum TaxID=2872037 RepID=UPI001EE2C9D6|nr:ABC transporter ATP-binding protein [Mesobacterium pallidum]
MTLRTDRGTGALELRALTKSYGGNTVLDRMDLTASEGEFISLVGPSGCGKTTTLNIVAGFEVPDGGDVILGGRSVLDVPSYRRGLGMVFQSHALFPHMTIADNVAFGLSVRRTPKSEIRARVAESLDLVRLSAFADRYPRELSGGQQQRVGIARALTVQPRIILMDEPLSSLDAKLRREMQVDLKRIQRAVGITALYVTHDQEEALTLSDRIVLMNKGRIEQNDTPEAIYNKPANAFVAGFIGEASFLSGTVVQSGDPGMVRLDSGTLLKTGAAQLLAGSKACLAIRPDRVYLRPLGAAQDALAGTVRARAFLGTTVRHIVELDGGGEIMAQLTVPESDGIVEDGRVEVMDDPQDWRLFPAEST